MHRIAVFLFIMAIGFSTFAQTFNLAGKVSNQSGQPVSGAIVTLVTKNMKDTTDLQGSYAFVGTAVTYSVPANSSTRHKISLGNGMLSISLATASPVEIGLFDMHGQQLDRIIDRNVGAGEYRVNMMHHQFGTRMMVIRVKTANSSTTLRYVPLSGMGQTFSSTSPTSSGSKLAKVQAAIDTLRVSATGYTTAKIPVESLSGEKNVTLEPGLGLDPFSFFVTSMKGLQELSGNEKGFGGNLSFGKTGQGAGLLGADSICGCLAEKSMPGARAKVWRAFLSAKKGVDGKQVNAIDRIGDGPWYDRLGRLVANNKSELLNDRPKNAHENIIDDLPNEFGIPNHRPDPTKDVVDNHLTITGSNAKGELFTAKDNSGGFGGGGFGDINSLGGGFDFGNPGDSITGWTCDDWTSTTIKANPRAGMSWPQSMMGMGGYTNWISAWNMSGCEAGYDLEEKTGAGKQGVYTIGNGGGYGGYYCFALTP
jgi:hypothetical protein